MVTENAVQSFGSIILLGVQVEVQHRIGDPLFLQIFNSQPLEKFFLPLKISLESRQQQTFPEAAGTAQKIRSTGTYHLPDKRSLIHIEISLFTQLLESLYPDGEFTA